MQTSARGEIVEVEIWISQEDLLPMRIEARFEEIEGSFRAIYSDFGAKYDITVTEKTLGEGSPILLFLWVGELSPEERGQLVRAFPAEGKECLEAEIGTDLYRKVLSGNSVADRVFLIALKFCERPIFSSRDDVIPNGITNNLYSLDLSALSILPGEKAEHVMECLRESIGLESLFEIGWEKRGPTPEEMAAAQMCKPRSEG